MSVSTDAIIKDSSRSCSIVDLSLFLMYDSFENPRSTDGVDCQNKSQHCFKNVFSRTVFGKNWIAI